jgi:putative DNA primase/helicase
MDNYQDVVHQMEAFGVEFTPRDLPLQIPTPKRKTFGKKGKWWYWLQLFRPSAGGEFVVGKFGTYKHGGSEQKVDIDWKRLSDEERTRMQAERQAAAQRAEQARHDAAELAALSAGELWARASKEGHSPYLERKGVRGEACRYLPDGTLVIPLLRYDRPRAEALRAVQRIQPDGFKLFTKGFSKTGCSVRLGEVTDDTKVVMVCEGYATGLSIRMATSRDWPVFVALDAYNLVFVVDLLRVLHRRPHILICADDDWKSEDHDGPNPGRTKARLAAKTNERCEIAWPVFDSARRQEKDTDFNDLHAREGLEVVQRQLVRVLNMIETAMEARGA